MSSQWSRSTWLDAWTETSAQMVESIVAANQATMEAFGVAPENGAGSDTDGDTEPVRAARAGDEQAPEGVGPAGELPDWETETTAETAAELQVGDRFAFTKTLTDEDIQEFARASGDTNPLHLDDEYAEQSRFGGRIAHGTLVSGLISASLARMPGLVVYLSQDLEFRNPVPVGGRVTADCEIVENLGNRQYRLSTVVRDEEATIIDGEAVVLIDEAPGEA